MKSGRQYRDAALGAFIGWVGVLVMCIIMVLFGCMENETTQKQHNFQVGELTAQDSLELKEPDAIYYDTIYDDMLDIDMDCGDDILRFNHIYYDSIPRYIRFTDVPAGTDTLIIVDEILYHMNNNKTAWIPIYPDEYVMWVGNNGDTIWK